MPVDYSADAIQQAEIYSQLPDIAHGETITTYKTKSHWYIDIKPTDPLTLPLFIQARDPIAQAAGLDPDDFVDIVWSCPRLMRRRGISSWPKSLLLGNQTPPLVQPTQTILFIKIISMFAGDWQTTMQTGQPHHPIGQTRPGYVHFRDIVIYRLMKQALLESGLQMRILPDHNERQALFSGAVPPQSKALSYCAKSQCMAMGMHPLKCSGCAIAYYCSQECSEADWKEQHEHECVIIQKEQELAALRLRLPKTVQREVQKSAGRSH